MRGFLKAMLLLAPVCALAAPEPQPEFRHAADLVLEGRGAFYALELPEAVYRGVERSDLGDLRVLNAAGEVVPHALLRASATERKPGAALELPMFPIVGPAGRPAEELALRVERRPDGTLSAFVAPGPRRDQGRRLLGYVIDATAVTVPLRELRFDWPAAAEGETLDVRVEASDDLQSWSGVGSGKLVVLRQGDLLLERRGVEITPSKSKYFRVTWRAAREDLVFRRVAAVQVDATADAARAWFRAAGTPGDRPGEFVFALPSALLVDRLRFELPQENAIAGASILLQERPRSPAHSLASATLYRLQHQGETLVNPDLEIAPTAARRWVLRVDTRGGGLGSGAPVLMAGYLPHRLVFVARGDGPFRVAFGDAQAQPTAMPIQALVPGYAADKPLPALRAQLGPIATRDRPAPGTLQALRAYVTGMDARKLWLWGALLLAVLVIVGMGWRLARQLPRPGEPPPPRPPYEAG
jgi:hypothetical protein